MPHATSVDGTTIAYDIAGDGPPLVYVTGACCFRRFKPVASDAAVFSTRFRVITYDRRGRGDSADAGPWSLDREVEDLESMIDALGGEAFVYGHSSGAVLALHAADRLGAKVLGVALYDAPWVPDETARAEYAVLRTEVEERLEAGRRAAALRRFLVGIGMPKAFVALLPLTPGWRTMTALAPTLRYDLALTAGLPPTEVAARLRVPVHVLVGEKSPPDVHEVAHTLARALPDGAVTTLPGQDHMVSGSALLPELVARLRPDSPLAAP